MIDGSTGAEVKDVSVTLNGSRHKAAVGGFGLTANVDGDFFDAWMQAHKDFKYVKEGMIFAHAKVENVEAQAIDNEAMRTGLEPVDPAKMPKGLKEADTKDDE